MDTLHRDANGEHDKAPEIGGVSRNADDLLNSENEPNLEKLSSSSSSSSSSSDTSSEGDFIQLGALDDPAPTATAKDETPKNDNGQSFELESEAADLSLKHNPSVSSYVLEDAKQSPPLQMMVRSDVPDPNRIPSSIFARNKSTTPMEWSVASNESLFSIHVGKSGELGFFGGPMEYPPVYPFASSALATPATPVTPVKEVTAGLATKPPLVPVAADSMKNVLKEMADGSAAIKDKPAEFGIGQCDSASRVSDASTTSFRSFAFPL